MNMTGLEPQKDPKVLETLLTLFDLHWQVAQQGQQLFSTEEAGIGCKIVEAADQIAGVIDTLAERPWLHHRPNHRTVLSATNSVARSCSGARGCLGIIGALASPRSTGTQ